MFTRKKKNHPSNYYNYNNLQLVKKPNDVD